MFFYFPLNSNSLKQADAEKTILEFLANNKIETPTETISPEAIEKIEETNVYTQFNTSVHVHFKNVELIFIFTRTPNKWFLKSVESDTDDVSKELKEWLNTKKKLNIAVYRNNPGK